MDKPNNEALAQPWMTGFDAMFDEAFFNGTTDYKVARDSIGIFVCEDSEWMKTHPELSKCGYSHDFIEKHVFGLGYHERFKHGSPEVGYMQGAFACAQALDLESI